MNTQKKKINVLLDWWKKIKNLLVGIVHDLHTIRRFNHSGSQHTHTSTRQWAAHHFYKYKGNVIMEAKWSSHEQPEILQEIFGSTGVRYTWQQELKETEKKWNCLSPFELFQEWQTTVTGLAPLLLPDLHIFVNVTKSFFASTCPSVS